jgi:hypothetical protein
MTDRETWALNYLRQRRAMIAEELTWLRSRIVGGHDPDEADDQIVDALAGELSEVSALIQAFDARVLH